MNRIEPGIEKPPTALLEGGNRLHNAVERMKEHLGGPMTRRNLLAVVEGIGQGVMSVIDRQTKSTRPFAIVELHDAKEPRRHRQSVATPASRRK